MQQGLSRTLLLNIHHVYFLNIRMTYIFSFFIYFYFLEEDARPKHQRPTTGMLGNEVMSKEQCYDLYQQILGVKKFEHQLLYNAMQVSPNIFCI